MLVPGSSTSSNWGSQKNLGKRWLPVMDPSAPFHSFCTRNLCCEASRSSTMQWRGRRGLKPSVAKDWGVWWEFSGGRTPSGAMHFVLLGWLCFYPTFWPWGSNTKAVTSIGCMEAATRSISPSFPIHPVLMHPPRMLQRIITLFLPAEEEEKQMAEDDRERTAFSRLLKQACDI